MAKREKDEALAKLSQTERMLAEGKHAIQKLEEDNSKLRRALEQNLTRLNRMSLDSDNYVDRYLAHYFAFMICDFLIYMTSFYNSLLTKLQPYCMDTDYTSCLHKMFTARLQF